MPIDSIASGLSSAGSALQGGVQSAFSSASSLAEKVGVSDIASGIKEQFGKASDAVGGLFKKSPAAKADTSFPSSTLPRAATKKDEKPVFQAAPVPGAPLVYPADMKYYTKISFYQYKRIIATDTPKQLPTATIILPMPSNLSEAFNVEYDRPELGAIAGATSDAAIKAISEMTGQNAGGVDAIRQALGQGTLSGVASGVGITASLNVLKNLKNQTAGDIVRKATGLTPNPYIATIFKNVNMRSHQFSYRFAPNLSLIHI